MRWAPTGVFIVQERRAVHCRVEGEMLLTPASLLPCPLLPVIRKYIPPKPIDVEPSVQM